MLRNIAFIIFKITCLIYLILSSYAWLNFKLPTTPMVGVVNVIMLGCLVVMGYKIHVNSRLINLFIFLFTIFISFAISRGMIFGVFSALRFLPAIYLFILPEDQKKKLLKFVSVWFAIFVGLGLILYFALMFVKIRPFLPPVGFEPGLETYRVMQNYIFYLKPALDPGEFIRFQAFFIEPGHLALVSIMILAANNFEFHKRWYMWVILSGILVSLSLAGYLLIVIGWVLLKIKDTRTIIATSIIGMIVIIGLQSWGGGDNIVNEKIFSRLETDKHRGIEGNNRTNSRTDILYDLAVSNGDVFFGVPSADKKKVEGAGYKKFFIQFGLVPAIFIFFFYWNLAQPNTRKRYHIGFFILIFLAFMDCEYPHWFSWLLGYTIGCGLQLKSKEDRGLKANEEGSSSLPPLLPSEE